MHGPSLTRRATLAALGAAATGALVPGSAAAQESTAEAVVRPARSDQTALVEEGWYCSVDAELLDALGIEVGQQVRIRRSEEEYAVYTVADAPEEDDAGVVRMGARGRERLDASDGFDATVRTPVPAPGLSVEEAQQGSELVERLRDPGSNELLVTAPHGGMIEPGTDGQGELLARTFDDATFWRCKGWRQGGGAFERWHVPTHDIRPASYPNLAEIADREFRVGISFQGIAEEGVRVGGDAPDEFAAAVRDAIDDAVGGSVGPVEVADARYQAETEDTLINWLTTEDAGLWIGQSREARESFGEAIATAVAEVVAEER